jgi:hypothetical protein
MLPEALAGLRNATNCLCGVWQRKRSDRKKQQREPGRNGREGITAKIGHGLQKLYKFWKVGILRARNARCLQGRKVLSAGQLRRKPFLFQHGKDTLAVVALDQNFAVLDRAARPAAPFQFSRKFLEPIDIQLKPGCNRHGLAAPALNLASDADDAVRRHG